jgi:hypothetical protein
MQADEIRAVVRRLDTTRAAEEQAAWEVLRPLGIAVTPYLREAYPRFKKWQGRVALVFHSIRHARRSDDAFQLGLDATTDRATLVRYRACGLLAYSLRTDALPALRALADHADARTAEDAQAAMAAIVARNHHRFVDRNHTGKTKWIVNEGDDRPSG